MTEPTYTLTLTESERTAMARSLGLLVTKLLNAPVFVESPAGGTAAARAVLSPPHDLQERRRLGQQKDDPRMVNEATARAAQDSPTLPSGHVPPTLPEPRDRWARNKKGVEVPNPEGCVAREINIWKTEQRDRKAKGKDMGPYLKVTWQSQGVGYVDANCFDKNLFPWLINSQGKKTTLYLVKSGEYLNVVGVRA